MPTLNWIGKDKVVSHHNEVPFHVLDHKYGYTVESGLTENETHSGNMIIHGDNLLALKSLMPMYKGRIKCIYIDPPYNTGNENWVYNDNVNDPHIKKWLGEVVDKAGSKFAYFMVFEDKPIEGAVTVGDFLNGLKVLGEN